MKRFLLALSFLTTIPIKLDEAPKPGDQGWAAACYPLAGLVIGLLLAGVQFLLAKIFTPLLAAGLVVLVWAALTGGLHLDGLADCCDGLLSAVSRERRLEIL
jgi:adenosylcobinamide-GDP ribazoletransferase